MKKMSAPFICIIIAIVAVGAIYIMIQMNLIQQNLVFTVLWIISASALAGYGFILLYEAGEYFLIVDFQEGLKKLLWGLLLIVFLAYPMAATVIPVIQIGATWDKPTFLKAPKHPITEHELSYNETDPVK